MMNQVQNSMIHIRFQGQSVDLPLNALDLNTHTSDKDIRQAVANYFDVAVVLFKAYVVERHANGNITIRPQAIFG